MALVADVNLDPALLGAIMANLRGRRQAVENAVLTGWASSLGDIKEDRLREIDRDIETVQALIDAQNKAVGKTRAA